MAWLLMGLRGLRDNLGSALGIAGLVLVTTLVFASAPRLLERAAEGVLQADVAAAAADARNIELLQDTRLAALPADPFGLIEDRGQQLEGRFPASVEALVSERYPVVDTPRWTVVATGLEDRTVRLRFQPGVETHLRLVAGRFPTEQTHPLAGAAAGPDAGPPPTVFESALSVATAAALNAKVGDTLVLALDQSDRLSAGLDERVALDVVGTYEETDPSAAYWLADTTLQQPRIRSLSSLVQFQDTTVLLASDAYPSLLAATDAGGLNLRYHWRYVLEPARFRAAAFDGLLADVRHLGNVYPAGATSGSGTLGPQPDTTLRTGLVRILADYQERWRSAQAVLTVAAIGPVVVALAALGLVALLAGQRRRGALGLARGRGASGSQIVTSLAAEGLLLSLPAALLALGLAFVLVPSGPFAATWLAAAGVAALAVVLFVASSMPTSVGLVGGRVDRAVPGRVGSRRLAFETLVVALALLGAVLLRERGVRGAGVTGQLTQADPLIAAVPALVGLAAAILAVRLFPLLMRGLVGLAAWRRELVPVLAMRRATRGGTTAPVLLVLLAAVTIGSFASATLVHLDRAAEAIAWQDVGAAFRLTAGGAALSPDLDPATLPGVEAAAEAYQAPVSPTAGGSLLQLVALDTPAYSTVVRGTPAELALPVELLAAPQPGAPIPALVSPGLVTGTTHIAVGDVFQLTVGGHPDSVRVVALSDTFPTIPSGTGFVIVSRDALAAASSAALAPTEAFLRAPDAALRDLRVALAASDPQASVLGRAAQTEQLRGSPVVLAVAAGVAAATAGAALYAALAVAAALALAAEARALEMAHLRVLGMSDREALRLVLVEHGPTVVAAFVGGLLLGLGLFVLLRQGLGFDAVVGSAAAVPLQVDPLHLAVLLAVVVAIIIAGVAIAAILQRRAAPAAAVRRGMP
ncbi:MAG: FtsX-like permease family protein [Candidatus Limnocylindrales bacterium]